MRPDLEVPDPFAPSMREDRVAWQNSMYGGQAIDAWICPAPDARQVPTDPTPPEDDLTAAFTAPRRDVRRAMLEETRFQQMRGVDAALPVFEVLRLFYSRPGYLSRIATFLEVRGALDAPGAAPRYLSNDLSDPDPFPITIPLIIGQGQVSLRWHLRLDEECNQAPPPFLAAAPPSFIPTAHRVGNLPAEWEDMRYHWGQRPPNKIARVRQPAFVRLFVEFLGDTATANWRVGAQLGGWEGAK